MIVWHRSPLGRSHPGRHNNRGLVDQFPSLRSHTSSPDHLSGDRMGQHLHEPLLRSQNHGFSVIVEGVALGSIINTATLRLPLRKTHLGHLRRREDH